MKKLIAFTLFTLVACKDKPKDTTAPESAKPAESAKPTATAPAAAVDKELTDSAPLDLGKGVNVSFTKKQTVPSGENQAPTMKHTVTAKCGGKDVTVLEREDEGGDAKVNVKTAGDQATFTMATHIAREGENLDETDTAVLDLATCSVTKK
ncbi:MAG TPA: hypothetical protein VMZ53_33095 [Kofleriaceae bacterium]|nr:hypothetical protein [Kofleriaceae bacterium]